ncbi:MAG: flavodoxin [Oscillochloris sp.]|nr:flavodoxin [Oscillochloris sp.]
MSTSPKKISRRQFLIGAAGVSVISLGGFGYWATRQPPLEFVERSYGSTTAEEKKVLVAYGSQYGSTGGVADAIGRALAQAGVAADVRRVEGVSDLSPYKAAIIGAPIISDKWMPAATSFVTQQRAALAAIPSAYFLTCMTLALSRDEADRAAQAKVLEAMQREVPEVRPVELGLFAGALDYSKMTPAMQQLYKFFSADDTGGDYRDFAAIGAWAKALRPRLLG